VAQDGAWSVTVSSLPAITGTITANQGGTWTVQQGGAPWSVSQSGTWTVQLSGIPQVTPTPSASGGLSRARVAAASGTNATSVKALPGQVYGMSLSNTTANARYFKLYDKGSAPTVGSDTPAWTELVPASGGRVVEFSMGIPLSTGIAYAITTGAADSDTGACTADDVHGVLLYK
jgi:hypothetical protein